MCNRPGWHEAGNEVSRLGGGLTLGQKCERHLALVRDCQPTLGELLAKLTAEREAERETVTIAGLFDLTLITDPGQEPGTMTLAGANGQRVTAVGIGTAPC